MERTRSIREGRGMRTHVLALAAAAAIAVTATHEARAGGCTPGQQIACACATGGTGAQSCSEDGSHFEPCLCAAPAPITVYTGRPPPRPAPPGRSTFNGGLAMTILGGLIGTGGGIMVGVDMQYKCSHLAVCVAGGAMMVVGIGMLIGGPILMVIGKNKEAAAEQPAMPAWIPAAVGISDREVSMVWRF